ncbi:hypothetical protein [Vibrio parahaemolyticus]
MNNNCDYINPMKEVLDSFLLEYNWKEDIIKLLKEYNNNYIENVINDINKSDYQSALLIIKDLVLTEQLSRSVLNRAFNIRTNHCLLIFGNVGSGKSLFCQNETIKRLDPENNIYNINRKLKVNGGKLDNAVTSTTIRLFKSIIHGDFTPVLPDKNITTIFIIDNYTEVLSKLNISMRMLYDAISKSTKHHKIKWIITKNDIASVIYNPQFKQLARYQFSKDDGLNIFPRSISGWFDLDYQNSIKKVPEEIFKNHNLRVYDIQVKDINHLPPAIVDLTVMLDDYKSQDIMQLVIAYCLDSLNISEANKSQVIEAINGINAIEVNNNTTEIKVGERNELLIDASTPQCKLLIKNGLLTVSNFNNEIRLVLSHPFLWAYFTSFNVMKNITNELITVYSQLNKQNTSFSLYLKMILQYQYFRHDSNINVTELLIKFGNIDGLLYFLSMCDDQAKLNFIKKLGTLATKSKDFNNPKKAKKYLPSASLYIFAITRCSYAIERHNFDKAQCIDLVRASSIAFKLLNNMSDAHMLADIFVHSFKEISAEEPLKALPMIYEMAATMSCYTCNKSRPNRSQVKFLSLVSKAFFKTICKDYTAFFKLVTDKQFKMKSINGKHLFCEKFFEEAFKKFVSDKSRDIDAYNANAVCHIASIMIEKQIYSHGITNDISDKKNLPKYYDFLLASKFHRAVGTYIRLLVALNINTRDNANTLLRQVSNIFNEKIPLARDPELTQGLSDGLLYIIRHIDLAQKNKLALLPNSLKVTVNSSLNAVLVSKNIRYEDTEQFISRTEFVIQKLKLKTEHDPNHKQQSLSAEN